MSTRKANRSKTCEFRHQEKGLGEGGNQGKDAQQKGQKVKQGRRNVKDRKPPRLLWAGRGKFVKKSTTRTTREENEKTSLAVINIVKRWPRKQEALPQYG